LFVAPKVCMHTRHLKACPSFLLRSSFDAANGPIVAAWAHVCVWHWRA
jgi:hypothetical protein